MLENYLTWSIPIATPPVAKNKTRAENEKCVFSNERLRESTLVNKSVAVLPEEKPPTTILKRRLVYSKYDKKIIVAGDRSVSDNL